MSIIPDGVRSGSDLMGHQKPTRTFFSPLFFYIKNRLQSPAKIPLTIIRYQLADVHGDEKVYFSPFSVLFFSYRWFCHFDDDNYVNVPALVRKLRGFDYRQDHYLGKPSIAQPLEILDRDHQNVRALSFSLN